MCFAKLSHTKKKKKRNKSYITLPRYFRNKVKRKRPKSAADKFLEHYLTLNAGNVPNIVTSRQFFEKQCKNRQKKIDLFFNQFFSACLFLFKGLNSEELRRVISSNDTTIL